MRRKGIAGPALAALAALLCARPCAAEAGRTAASTLRRSLGSRAVALGEAYAAVEGGPSSMGYNPAALSGLQRPALETTYVQGIVDDHFGFMGYAHPASGATWMLGAAYYDAGRIRISLSNGFTDTRNAQQDMVALGGLSLPLGRGLSAGGLFKVFRLTLADEARAGGYAGDAGLLWRTPLRGLNLGASAQNLGPEVKFEKEGDPLPLTTRFGAAYLLDLERAGLLQEASYVFTRFLLTADGIKVREERLAAGLGLEMGMPLGAGAQAALRFGYVLNRDLDSFTFGIGLAEKRFSLDYALAVKRAINNAHHFTFGVRF